MKIQLLISIGCVAVCLGARSFEIAPEARCDIEVNEAACPRLLRIRSRIALPSGHEAWGAYFLRLKLNGQPLRPPLLNAGRLWNISKLPPTASEPYSEAEEAWFVKADSNFMAFDCEIPGNEFRKSTYLQRCNIRDDRSGYTNSYYDKVFRIPSGRHRLTLQNLSSRHALAIDVQTAPMRSELLFFVPCAGKGIYPWSFPECHEIGRPLKIRLCPGERDSAILALRNMTKETFVSGFRLFPFTSGSHRCDAAVKCDIRVQAYEEEPGNEGFRYAALAGERILLPDRLIASNRWEVPSHSSGALWLIVQASAEAIPGTYHSELMLSGTCRIPVEVEVLPFKLAESPRLYGLWTNSLPGADEASRARQIRDLREHGIHNFILDAWTVPVRPNKDGSWDTSRFDWTLSWLKQVNMNRPTLIYGLLGPLLQDIGLRAGKQDYASVEFQKTALDVFRQLHRKAEKQGFRIYFHLEDEPDIHPQRLDRFIALSRALKGAGLRLCSNLTPAGMHHVNGLVDMNLTAASNGLTAGWCGQGYSNPFYPKWPEAPADFIRKNCRFSYVQVRSVAALAARTEFGFYCDAMQLKGMWGFAYFWGINRWNIAYPLPEQDGRCGTTAGWEMLHAGILDSRYLHTLKKIAEQKHRTVAFQLPGLAELQCYSMEEIARLRQDIIDEILNINR